MTDAPLDERRLSLVELRAMTSQELVIVARTTAHDLVRTRAQIELDKRAARRPINRRIREREH